MIIAPWTWAYQGIEERLALHVPGATQRAMPGKGSGGIESPRKGHPLMYGAPKPAKHYEDFPDGGGYPKGFIEWCCMTMGCTPDEVLHLCSGSIVTGTRVDVRASVHPDVVADCRNTPFADASFDFILADPPYSEDYAHNLYDTRADYPRPNQILKEACRLLRPGGHFGLLHHQVPVGRKPMKMIGVYGVTTGGGYAIRAWTLFKKQQ